MPEPFDSVCLALPKIYTLFDLLLLPTLRFSYQYSISIENYNVLPGL